MKDGSQGDFSLKQNLQKVLIFHSINGIFTLKTFLGPFWDSMNNSMFNTLESHTLNPEEAKKRKRAEEKAINDELAAKVAASLASKPNEEEITVVEECN